MVNFSIHFGNEGQIMQFTPSVIVYTNAVYTWCKLYNLSFILEVENKSVLENFWLVCQCKKLSV